TPVHCLETSAEGAAGVKMVQGQSMCILLPGRAMGGPWTLDTDFVPAAPTTMRTEIDVPPFGSPVSASTFMDSTWLTSNGDFAHLGQLGVGTTSIDKTTLQVTARDPMTDPVFGEVGSHGVSIAGQLFSLR